MILDTSDSFTKSAILKNLSVCGGSQALSAAKNYVEKHFTFHQIENDGIPVETDSYIAVQLIEEQKAVDFDALKSMAEELLGSYTFSVLDASNSLWLIKGSNPLHLIHFPALGLYVYASTKEIMSKALKTTRLNQFHHVVINTYEGDILRIDRHGNLSQSKFVPKEDLRYQHWGFPSLYGYCWDPKAPADPFDDSYAELIELCGYFGVDEEEVQMLFEMGYSYNEIEGFLMNPSELEAALCSEA